MFEVELKSLLEKNQNPDEIIKNAEILFPKFRFINRKVELTTYFSVINDHSLFVDYFEEILPGIKNDLIDKSVSIRIREVDHSEVRIIVKIKKDSLGSINGVIRKEYETIMEMSFEELEELIVSFGYKVDCKWSRERWSYDLGDAKLFMDKNSGYGYLVEVEKLILNLDDSKLALLQIQNILDKLNLQVVSSSKLDKMLSFYMQHWQNYYLTDRVFDLT